MFGDAAIEYRVRCAVPVDLIVAADGDQVFPGRLVTGLELEASLGSDGAGSGGVGGHGPHLGVQVLTLGRGEFDHEPPFLRRLQRP